MCSSAVGVSGKATEYFAALGSIARSVTRIRTFVLMAGVDGDGY